MDVMSFVKKIKNLPTYPPVLQRICRVMENRESTILQVIDAIRLDPVVAGKVIHLANSAYTGIPRKISSLQNAVGLLGTSRTSSMVAVLQHVTQGLNNPTPPFSLERYWRHSLGVALVAESIARHYQRYSAIDEQEAFSAGLLHDIGKLVLAVYEPVRLFKAYEQGKKDTVALYRAEEPAWSHSAIGYALAKQWDFPAELTAVISGHHGTGSQTEYASLVAIVHVADVMIHTVGLPVFPDETVPQIDENSLEMVRLPPERLRIIAETVMEAEKKIEEECGI